MIVRRNEGISDGTSGRKIRVLAGEWREENKVRLKGIRRSEEAQQEEDIAAAIVDRQRRRSNRVANIPNYPQINPIR